MKKILLLAAALLIGSLAKAQLGMTVKEISENWKAKKVDIGHYAIEDDLVQFNFYFNKEGVCFEYQYNSKSVFANSFLMLILQDYVCLNPNDTTSLHYKNKSNEAIIATVSQGLYMSAVFFNKNL
jgi:hypothetical protein